MFDHYPPLSPGVIGLSVAASSTCRGLVPLARSESTLTHPVNEVGKEVGKEVLQWLSNYATPIRKLVVRRHAASGDLQ